MQADLTRVLFVSITINFIVLATNAIAGDVPSECPAKPADEESATALASTWFKKAEKAYADKGYDEAVSNFRCSLRMVEHPATYYNAAQAAVDAVFGSITKTLKKKGTVTLVGFGTFKVDKRKARKGRNPQTGEEIKIKAKKVPKFVPGKALKEAIK